MKVATNYNKVALTIDDAVFESDASSLRDILRELERFKAHATFFVIANETTLRHRDLLVQMVRNGHSLSNHGISESLHAAKSPECIVNEIRQCEKFLESIYSDAGVSRTRRFYRPGGGIPRACMFLPEHEVALGSIYPHDPFFHSPRVNCAMMLAHGIVAGDVIILHDRKWTAETLRLFLPQISQRNLKITTLEDLCTVSVSANCST